MYKQINKMTAAKNFRFVPNNDDKAWLYKAMYLLDNNGLLVTDTAFYRKKVVDGKPSLVCEKSIDLMFNDSHNIVQIETDVNRMKTVSEAIGINFVDARAQKVN